MSGAEVTGSPGNRDATPSRGCGPGQAEEAGAARRERIRAALREVIDPEVGLDVVTMGLVYGIEVEGASVRVRHTLTTPGCPMGSVLEEGIAEAAGSVPGVEDVETELVWEPRWDPGMIDDDAWIGREDP